MASFNDEVPRWPQKKKKKTKKGIANGLWDMEMDVDERKLTHAPETSLSQLQPQWAMHSRT